MGVKLKSISKEAIFRGLSAGWIFGGYEIMLTGQWRSLMVELTSLTGQQTS